MYSSSQKFGKFSGLLTRFHWIFAKCILFRREFHVMLSELWEIPHNCSKSVRFPWVSETQFQILDYFRNVECLRLLPNLSEKSKDREQRFGTVLSIMFPYRFVLWSQVYAYCGVMRLCCGPQVSPGNLCCGIFPSVFTRIMTVGAYTCSVHKGKV